MPRRRPAVGAPAASPSASRPGKSGGLLVPKPEVKEEVDDDEAVKAAKVAAYFQKQRLLASTDDPEIGRAHV